MSMSDDTTIAGYLSLDEPAQIDAAKKQLQQSQEMARGKASLRGAQAAAADAMIDAAKTMLDTPLTDVIGGAWGKWRDLQRYAMAPPDETHEVTLHEHEIALSRKPSIDLLLDGAPTGLNLQFELKIALTISGALLKVQGGRIIGADLGTVRGGGSFSCGKVTLAKRETSQVQVPGTIAFNPGISVR